MLRTRWPGGPASQPVDPAPLKNLACLPACPAAAELAVFALPLSPLTLLPNFFFGALVMWIGVDILKDWLFVSFRRVALVEYALLVFTFAAVLAMGLEAGIAAGVAASALHFAVEYARLSVRTFAVVPSRSGAVRSFEQRTVLEAFAGRVAAVALSGMVFFGSATKVAEQALAVAAAVLQTQPHLGDDSRDDEAGAAPQGGTAPPRGMRPVPSQRTLCATYDHFEALTASGGLEGAGAALQEAPLVLLLDLTRVHGIDATAARTFATLHTRLARRGVRLALTGLRADEAGARMRRVLVGQGLILEAPTDAAAPPGPGFLGPAAAAAAPAPTCAWFESMDAGLCWCEEQFLDVAVRRGLCRPRPDRVSLAEVLRSNLELPRLLLGPAPVDYAAAAARLEQFCARREVAAGEAVFERGEAANDVYIVERGTVACHIDFLATTVHSRAAAAAVPGMAAVRPARVLRFGPGGIVGDLDFMLQRPRSYSAVCERAAVAWVLPRAGFERLAAEAPQVLVLLQTVMLRLNCLSATHALAALESTAA
jgi:SulP family sulfate permease